MNAEAVGYVLVVPPSSPEDVDPDVQQPKKRRLKVSSINDLYLVTVTRLDALAEPDDQVPESVTNDTIAI